jgi:hypothetical protein
MRVPAASCACNRKYIGQKHGFFPGYIREPPITRRSTWGNTRISANKKSSKISKVQRHNFMSEGTYLIPSALSTKVSSWRYCDSLRRPYSALAVGGSLRRLVTRWEYYEANFLGLVQLACILILMRNYL